MYIILEKKKRRKNSRIIENFGSNHDAGDKEAMNIERNHQRIRIPVNQAIDIHERHHEARRAAARVFVDSLHVLIQADRRSSDAME